MTDETTSTVAAGRSAPGSGEAATELGQRIVLENDRVRVWELTLEPGADTGMHRHDLDYLLVILEGDRVAGDGHPTSENFSGRRESAVTPGGVYYVPRGGVENAVNTGAQRYREIIIELKD